jgi:hypothetical protein
MKIKLKTEQLGGTSPAQWLRRAGYVYIVDRQTNQESFARRFNRDFYPRFHLYVQTETGQDFIFFNLHLDHKKASYEGQSRHSADYDGELVQEEAARLKALLIPINSANHTQVNTDNGDVLNRLQVPDISQRREKINKKSWWRKIF